MQKTLLCISTSGSWLWSRTQIHFENLQQFFETTLWLQFLPIAVQFQYQAKQSLGETAMRRRIVKNQHKTASNCTAVACKRQERKKDDILAKRVQVGKSLFEQGLLIARDTSFSIRQSLPNPWGIRELFGQKKGRERGRKWGMEKKVGSEEMGGEGWQRVHGGIFLHRLKPPPQALPRLKAGILFCHNRNKNRHRILILSDRGPTEQCSVHCVFVIQIPNVLMILQIVQELKATGIAQLEITGLRRTALEVGLPAKMCSPCEEDCRFFLNSGDIQNTS